MVCTTPPIAVITALATINTPTIQDGIYLPMIKQTPIITQKIPVVKCFAVAVSRNAFTPVATNARPIIAKKISAKIGL